MKYQIPFGKEMLYADLPKEQVLFYAEPIKPEVPSNADVLIEEALDHPIGTKRLEEMVTADQKILILSDDLTRPTPKRQLIEHILKRLKKVGVPDKNITICLAPGTHRTMTDKELLETFGSEMLQRFEILNINYKYADHLVYLGDTPTGTPIEVYREAIEADFIIGIGNIVPHMSAGWGGGAKIVQPGICGEKTTRGTHLMAALEQNIIETCGNAENKCRHEMEVIARQVGLKFIMNTVMDEHKHILGVFCGDCVEAHRAGVVLAKQVMCPEIPERADILIASANPCQIDFWQGGKPFTFAQHGIKDGGTIIFVMAGEEGLCGNAPEHDYVVRNYSTTSEEKIREDVKNGVIKDAIAIDTPICCDQVRKRGVHTLLVTKGLSQEDCNALGFEMASTLEDALEKAFAKHGKDAKVGIIPYCGETLVFDTTRGQM